MLLRGARTADVRHRAAFLSDPEPGATLRQIVNSRLRSVLERASGLSLDLVDRLRELEQLLGIDVVDALRRRRRSPPSSRPVPGCASPARCERRTAAR
ncbi:hypothetical protein V2J52_14155 [Georgenia sp. MJ173]|uniref:hypothetical protein n=1 Tax=Georgenia sunbinii TaxID=3117728 RepID=UPI002F25F575